MEKNLTKREDHSHFALCVTCNYVNSTVLIFNESWDQYDHVVIYISIYAHLEIFLSVLNKILSRN
jgi:hypothetical protein